MRHEKIFKRKDGSRTKIEVVLNVGAFIPGGFRYDIMIYTCQSGKRTWQLMFEDATPAEILQAQLELWEKLKP